MVATTPPFTTNGCPRAVSDAANALRQKRALMTADGGAFGSIVLRHQQSTAQRRHTERREVVAGYQLGVQAPFVGGALRACADVERGAARGEGAAGAERLLQELIARVRKAKEATRAADGVWLAFTRAFVECDELVRRRQREWAQQHGVEQREHRDVDADAESQRDHDPDCEAGRPSQPASSVAHIRPELLERRLPTDVVHAIAYRERAAEIGARRARRVRAALARGDSGFDVRLEVGAQLVVQVGIVAAAADERSEDRTAGAGCRS